MNLTWMQKFIIGALYGVVFTISAVWGMLPGFLFMGAATAWDLARDVTSKDWILAAATVALTACWWWLTQGWLLRRLHTVLNHAVERILR